MKLSFSPFPILSTARLTLRQLVGTDANNIHLLRSNHDVNKMVGREISKGIADAQAFMTKIDTMTANNDGIYWVIELNKGSQFAGTICLYNFNKQKQEAEIGYELLPEWHGKGLATEAVTSVIDYAFNTMRVNVVTAIPAEMNTPSIKLLEKLTFKFAGSFIADLDKVVLLNYILKRS